MSIQSLSLSRPELTLLPQALVEDALDAFLAHGINHLAICDETGHFVGMASSNALLHLLLPSSARVAQGLSDLSFAGDATTMLSERLNDLKTQPIAAIIDHDVPTLRMRDHLLEAALLLSRSGSPVPVVDAQGVLLGLISRRALLAFLDSNGKNRSSKEKP